jgi:hypothetical protein
MEKGLALSPSTEQVSLLTILNNLCNVSSKSFPARDLAHVLERQPSSHVIATIPLKPPPRVVRVYPALFSPHGEWLARAHTEVVEAWIRSIRCKFCMGKPALGKLITAVAQIHSPKHPELEHFFWGKVGGEARIKVPPRRSRELVGIPALHTVIHRYSLVHTSGGTGFGRTKGTACARESMFALMRADS